MALMDIGFFSESLGMAVHCMALLPHAREGETLPKRQTLYLLHGYGDSYTSWIRKTNLERYAAHHNLGRHHARRAEKRLYRHDPRRQVFHLYCR